MNKKQYINELYVKLRWRLPASQVDDILCDYSEYFDIGIAEGKSEQQLCEDFGSVRQLTTSILDERNLIVKQCLRFVKIGLVFLSCCSFLLISFTFLADFFSFSRYRILAVCIPVLLLVITGEYSFSRKRIQTIDSRKCAWVGVGGALFSVAMAIITTILVSQVLLETLPSSTAAVFTPYHYFVLNLPTITVLIVSVLWLIKTYFVGNATYYDGATHFLYAAVAAGICCCQRDLVSCNFEETGIATEVFVRSIVYQVTVLLALGIAYSIIWMIYIRLIGRKRRAN